jgi:hypothetical protein
LCILCSFQELHSNERFETLANLLCVKPRKLLPLFDEALRKAEVDIAEMHEMQEDMSFKAHVHARITLMECPGTSTFHINLIFLLLTIKTTTIVSGSDSKWCKCRDRELIASAKVPKCKRT